MPPLERSRVGSRQERSQCVLDPLHGEDLAFLEPATVLHGAVARTEELRRTEGDWTALGLDAAGEHGVERGVFLQRQIGLGLVQPWRILLAEDASVKCHAQALPWNRQPGQLDAQQRDPEVEQAAMNPP